jgi:CyaY protein
MDRQLYLRLADACLERFADWLENFDPDEVDFSTADGVLTLEFADGMRYVLNRQAAANQMWFAAADRAWHYDWDAEQEIWKDDRDGHELGGNVAERVSEKLGRVVAPA